MLTRRAFLQSAALAASVLPARAARTYATGRPPLADRKFSSDVVEAKIQDVRKRIADPEVAWMFENCFPNTLDTTVRTGELDGKPDTFVITGDIDAMWLRDSAAQVWPYLPLAKDDAKLKTMLAGVVNRQARCVRIDPYANAFNFGASGSEWSGDHTRMRPELHERKWEIDSLCYTVRLAHGYWKATGDDSCFDPAWQQSAALIVKTFREQQRERDRGPYSFQRTTENPSDSLPQGGYGNPTRPCGMIHSAFRPSDDACIFPFLIPSNLFAVTSLEQLAEIYTSALSDRAFADGCRGLAAEIREGIAAWAAGPHGHHGEIYAFEADGYGNQLFMDDGNAPSLLSLPYLGCCGMDDPLYRRTRAFVLSDDNPYFYRGAAGEGLGGPHSGLEMIWPLGIITRALTTRDEKEIAACLATLKGTHAGTGFMHESFFRNDPTRYTRKWFAWANTLFGELILHILDAHPSLLAR
ncbi:MAG TPA: glycoside hydrolase family 125 protein [Bryobacteraceae bacterium]|jgi:meiotically up-regulated gene 157 (Mug157) protein|nr:glycoside hydrolase family 125 protein [Bryobacteraceae bacterium]